MNLSPQDLERVGYCRLIQDSPKVKPHIDLQISGEQAVIDQYCVRKAPRPIWLLACFSFCQRDALSLNSTVCQGLDSTNV